ncbi:MAG: exodeoxyribonuclease V subunit gamma [Clostridia bacterium]|nr:exodeoxyribonuclease V subunit gamma [Clostridia bacterium]
MLSIIYGLPGSRKSDHIHSLIIDNLASGGNSVLVVPEQKALTEELRIYEKASSYSLLGLEVINFDKLCETVFRKCGSLSLKYVTDSTKKLLLSRALADISPALKECFGRYDDQAYISQMLTQLTEFKNARITPGSLASANRSLSEHEDGEHGRLSRKLEDLSLIFASYNTLVNEVSVDPCDRLTKAAELILAHDPFSGHKVFFDSFNGFTAQEYQVITALLSCKVDVTVSLCHPGNDASEVFLYTEDTENRLLRCAASANAEISKTIISDGCTYNSPALEHIAKNFTLTGSSDAVFESNDVAVISCSDMFDECETCASLISRDVHNGSRYRDIMVVVRDLDSYKGLIDTAFERYCIPYFFSDKTDITQKSLVRFILSALSICKSTPKYTDIITYIRCGLTDLTDFETDMLESYAAAWKITGKIWYSDDGFTMNPRGYIPLTGEDAEMLEELNSLRERVMQPLDGLRADLKKCKTVSDHSRAIYAFLTSGTVREKLADRTVTMQAQGEPILAAEEAGLWKALCDALDELDNALGTHECDHDEYVKLLNMILSDTDIGTIPQSGDVVTVTDATMLRAHDIKHTFMLGCEDGVFPKNAKVPGVLSVEERKVLAEHNLDEIAFDPVTEASRELFHFYCTACSPSDKLTLSYSRHSLSNDEQFPSSALLRISSMFGDITVNSSELDICDKITSTSLFIEHIQYLKNSIPDDMISSFINSNEAVSNEYKQASLPISRVDECLSSSSVQAAFPGDLYVSQSVTDSYSKCPFSFQCKYSLKLRDKTSDSIQKNDIGTLVHAVLDDFLQGGYADTVRDGTVDRDEVIRRIRDITDKRSKLLLEFTPEEKRSRVSRMLDRVAELTAASAANLAEEFTQSNFVSSFCEFPISAKSKGGLLPIKLTLEDGSFLVLGGIADRVDTMVKGGKLYIRVADYKTGSRTFSLESVRAGMSLQLLIYLFSIWENADEAFKKAVGAAPDCEVIPAAAEYIMTMPKGVAGTQDHGELIDSLSRAFKRSGIYLADSDIINDMDKGITGKFVPVSSKLTTNKQAVMQTLEEFRLLKNELSGILINIGNGIKSGNAVIKPLQDPDINTDACAYCQMKPVCKNAGAHLITEE